MSLIIFYENIAEISSIVTNLREQNNTLEIYERCTQFSFILRWNYVRGILGQCFIKNSPSNQRAMIIIPLHIKCSLQMRFYKSTQSSLHIYITSKNDASSTNTILVVKAIYLLLSREKN